MPEKLKKMIGVVMLVCAIGGVSCVGVLGPSVDRVKSLTNSSATDVKVVE